MYRRFLRARQHDIPRAVEMWTNHLAWRREIGADTILEDFHFPERDAFISLYPQGYCNVDKIVRRPSPVHSMTHMHECILKRCLGIHLKHSAPSAVQGPRSCC